MFWKAWAVPQWENTIVLLYERHIVPKGEILHPAVHRQTRMIHRALYRGFQFEGSWSGKYIPATQTSPRTTVHPHTSAQTHEYALEVCQLTRAAYMKSALVVKEAWVWVAAVKV